MSLLSRCPSRLCMFACLFWAFVRNVHMEEKSICLDRVQWLISHIPVHLFTANGLGILSHRAYCCEVFGNIFLRSSPIYFSWVTKSSLQYGPTREGCRAPYSRFTCLCFTNEAFEFESALMFYLTPYSSKASCSHLSVLSLWLDWLFECGFIVIFLWICQIFPWLCAIEILLLVHLKARAKAAPLHSALPTHPRYWLGADAKATPVALCTAWPKVTHLRSVQPSLTLGSLVLLLFCGGICCQSFWMFEI